MQQAAAATYGAAYGMQPQYYQGMYRAATYGNYPYYGNYGTMPTYPQSPSSMPVTTTPTVTPESKASKKGEFSLPGSKEKQVKSMMEKWSTFKDESKGL